MMLDFLFRITDIPHTPLLIHSLGRLLDLALPVGLPLEKAGPGIADLAIAACWPDPLQERIAESESRTQQIAVVRQGREVVGIEGAAPGILIGVVRCDTLGQRRHWY